MTETSSYLQSRQTTIRDAACVVVIDSSGHEPTVLMGRRHADQIFLPGKWVFPGGRVDEDDRVQATRFAGSYTPVDLAPAIRPFALAALRELREEAGLVIGEKAPFNGDGQAAWRNFVASGYAPAPCRLFPVARAITPPGRVRRYDTWFFTAPRSAVRGQPTQTDGELLDLDWFAFEQARKLDLPNITRLVLADVILAVASAASPESSAAELPFYYSDTCGFRRTLISCKVAPSPP